MIRIRRIAGTSMLPAIRPGQLVAAVRKKPQVGDVVLATVDGRDVVKRVGQLSGGRVYLLGDNPTVSTDSRTYGFITAKAVFGVVMWPLVNINSTQA